jgi:DNA-binding LacI/PurR family transcriptional regulator
MTTAKDIAERLNLSVSTVGRALADDRRISAETKFRVNQVAVELGYVANRAARIMRGASSPVVGLVVPDVRNSFYSTVAHALSETLSERDHQVMLCETGDDRRKELRHVRDLAAAQVGGVVIVPTPKPLPEVAVLLSRVLHVQFLRKVPSLGPHWFGIDDHGVIRQATEHLLELGHRRIGYIGGGMDVPTGAARLSGYDAALAAAQVERRDDLVVVGPPSSADFGATALRELLGREDPPTGIVTASVQMTRGAVDFSHRSGLTVPGDFSLVGFGDEVGFSWWGPGLTTVSLPMHDLAASCGAWLLQRFADQHDDDNATPYSTLSSGVLVVRGSTAAPAPPRR